MTPRLKDIAKAANVELSSVSRILRNDPRANELREETRERVLRIAKELGYRRNVSAATIRSGVNDSTIALVCDPKNAFSEKLLFYLMEYLNQKNLAARCYAGSDMKSIYAEIAGNQIRYVINNRLTKEDRLVSAECARKYGMKMVFIASTQEFPEFPVFDNANEEIMRKGVQYLHSLGHTRIAYSCGPHEKHASTEQRHNGYLKGLQDCGLPFEPGLAICGEYDRNKLLAALKKYNPTALCAIDSGIALRAALALERIGVRIPDDISILTFGDDPVLVYYAEPNITGLRETGGGTLIQDIFDFLFHSDPATPPGKYSRFYGATLIPRASTAAPNPKSELSKRLSEITIEPEQEKK